MNRAAMTLGSATSPASRSRRLLATFSHACRAGRGASEVDSAALDAVGLRRSVPRRRRLRPCSTLGRIDRRAILGIERSLPSTVTEAGSAVTRDILASAAFTRHSGNPSPSASLFRNCGSCSCTWRRACDKASAYGLDGRSVSMAVAASITARWPMSDCLTASSPRAPRYLRTRRRTDSQFRNNPPAVTVTVFEPHPSGEGSSTGDGLSSRVMAR